MYTSTKKEPRFLLMYSALQFAPSEMAKPDGSLSLTYIAGALRREQFDVRILDVSVGNEKDVLDDTFFKTTLLPSGLIRCGMSRERIEQEIADFDVIGISSIFTTQTSMVFELLKHIKEVAPEKLVIVGGVNARNLRDRFFKNGVDFIILSEGENVIVEIGKAIRGGTDIREINGIAYQNGNGKEIVNKQVEVVIDLDQLPFPAWDLLPLQKYWDISRPHGGDFPDGERIKYGALQTSRGCPFTCLYCHISKEDPGTESGEIGNYRVKSIERVIEEFRILKDLGVKYTFFEDDSLLAKKKRAYTLFRGLKDMGLHLSNVNGINLIHLLKRENGKLVLDIEFLESISEAGFRMLHLPFESANQRVLDKYSSSKWNIANTDTEKMIRVCNDLGIMTAGNYTIGYPDESLEEIQRTILLAKRHIEQGLNHAAIFSIVPFPGTRLYDMVIENGQLDKNFNTDHMKWTKSILKNTPVSAEILEHMRQLAWLTVNRSDYVAYKVGMRVNTPVLG